MCISGVEIFFPHQVKERKKMIIHGCNFILFGACETFSLSTVFYK